jgi:DNA polymerase III epsilon subunit family exonuclease
LTPPARSLIHRIAEALRDGPVHTLDLARDVLGLRGHEGAASAAIFTLLGDDRRFRVDGAGRWSLRGGGEHLGRPLGSLSFAVVDVETTGGPSHAGHRIVEIAVVEVVDGAVTGDFRTLVNPGRAIPWGVQTLTGITPAMVASAPTFEHVAPRVVECLEGRVFVAHNVAFDWRFVADELVRAGYEPPEVRRLCTVRMARRLVPRLRRRTLDELTRHFGVPIHERALRGIHDLDALQGFLRRPPLRRRTRQPELFDGAETAPEGTG